jgi:nucleotide-binding universal stress UspA family protein
MSNLFWEYGRGQKTEDRSQKTRRQEDRKMEESGTEGPIVAERVLVALDASPQSQAALRAAARVAAAMQAELLGLFVEDANLFHLCNSPFCREVGLRTAVVRQLESQTVERQLRVLAAEMRRSLARVAGEAQVHWSFQVTRGAVEHELLTAAENSVLLSLGRTSWLTGSRLGSTTRMVVQRTLRPLLILGNHDGLTHPLTVIYNGSPSADRALALAVRLAQRDGHALNIFLVGPDDATIWQTQIATLLQAETVQPTFLLIESVGALAGLLQRMKNNSLVLPLEYAELLAMVEGPVLLVP